MPFNEEDRIMFIKVCIF